MWWRSTKSCADSTDWAIASCHSHQRACIGGGSRRATADTAALLDGSIDELRQSLKELRDLARGIHPAVLSERGLEPAVRALAARAPVPVDIVGQAAGRLPAAVETAAYFVVSEALTNVSKYAHAEHATVRVERVNGQLLVEVSDDGVDGPAPATAQDFAACPTASQRSAAPSRS